MILTLLSMVCAVAFLPSLAANAQGLAQHTQDVKQNCLGGWETQACMKALSSVAMTTVVGYADLLDKSGNKAQLEPLKQHCAASTAALKQDVPAYAMKSALTECVNHISDTNDKVGVPPDVSLYQFLVAGVLCIGKDPMCAQLEANLKSMNP